MTIKCKDPKLIQILDMVCPSDQNYNEKVKEKLQNYQRLTYEIKERRPGYHVNINPVFMGLVVKVKSFSWGEGGGTLLNGRDGCRRGEASFRVLKNLQSAVVK